MPTSFEMPNIPQQPQPAELSMVQNAWQVCHDLGRNALHHIKTSKAVRRALAIGIAVNAGMAIGTTTEMADPHPNAAMADTGGYPDWDKPCVAGDPMDPNSSYGKTTGTGNWCDDYQWGTSPTQQNSSRGYGYRNCTDWVAWRAQNAGVGSVPGGWHDGGNWDNAAVAAGKTVDTTPEPGDIAVWDPTTPGGYGHVAFVESVNANGTANISEYNKSRDGNYGTRDNITANHYIDLNGTGKGLNGEAWPPTSTPDTDGDGIVDTQDQCPTVPGTAAYNGCPPPHTTTVGAYDPNGAIFYLRDENTPGPAGVSANFGNSNWMPLSGDWDGNGTFTPGAYDPATGMFYLRDSKTPGAADRTFQYGNIGWKPIAGDWDGNGYSSVGLYDPATSTFYLKNFNGAGGADITFPFGNGGWEPLAGDWDGELDGNHNTTIGVYNPATGMFYLNNENDSSAAESNFQYGNVGWTPISGDWDGNRFHSIGQYNPGSATFYLRNMNDSGPADVTVQYGNAGWVPVVGDWNGGV